MFHFPVAPCVGGLGVRGGNKRNTDFEKWMLLFPHGDLILAGPARNQLEFFNPCGKRGCL